LRAEDLLARAGKAFEFGNVYKSGELIEVHSQIVRKEL
jgi:hypothetical protein